MVATGASRDLVAGVSATHLIHVNSRLSSLSSQDQVCSDGDAYPFAAVGAVGFIENKRVRVCGGVDSRYAVATFVKVHQCRGYMISQ